MSRSSSNRRPGGVRTANPIPKGEFRKDWSQKSIEELTSLPLWDPNERILVSRRVQPVVLIDRGTVSDRILNLPPDPTGVEMAGDVSENIPEDNADPVVTVSTGEIWEVMAIYAGISPAADANPDRTLRLLFKYATEGTDPVTLTSHWASDSITVPPGQDGIIFSFGDSDSYWTNINGTVALVSKKLTTLVLPAASTIKASGGAKQPDDRLVLSVVYRRVA